MDKMKKYLLAQFDKLAIYINLNNEFAKRAIAEVIANHLIEQNFVSNKTLALRISHSFIDYSKI